MWTSLKRLQDRLGYTFGDKAVLLQAMTHTSFGHERLSDQPVALRNNERLEFLGDAVLDVVVSDLLLEGFPNAPEGQLSKMRASLVNEKTLADIARSLGIDQCVRLGKGEIQTGGRNKPSILSSTFEALIAAIYLDGGFNAVYPVVRYLFAPFFKDNGQLSIFADHKTQLQEILQARWKIIPTYHLVGTEGPDHAKVFDVEVKMNGETIARSQGNSKKEAEQNAARQAIESITQI